MAPQADTTPTAEPATGAGRAQYGRRLRSVLSDSVAYGVGVGMLPGALLVATPFIARRVGPDGFGGIDLLTAILTLASAAAILGMDTGLARGYFDYDAEQREERMTVIRTGFVSVFVVSVVLAALLAFASLFFAEVLHQRPSAVSIGATVAAFILLPLSNGVVMAREVFRIERERRNYVISTGIQAIVGVGAALALVEAGGGPAGYFGGLGIGALLSLAYCLWSRHQLFGAARLDRRQLRTMLGYGLPLVPAALATWVTFAVDRTLLAWMRGLFDVGYYALASKIAAPLFMCLNAFTVAWIPFILNQSPSRQLELRARAVTAVAAASGIGYICVLLFAPELIDLLGGPPFHPSLKAVPGIALGWLAWGVAFVIATEFVVARKTKVIAFATAIAAAVNVLLNIALIPPFGFVGAAWATTATFTLLAVIYLFVERRSTPAPYRWARLGLIATVLVGASIVLLRSSESLPHRVPAACIAVALLIAIAGTDRGTAQPLAAEPR